MKKWFAYHPEEGFQRFETADEAREQAHAWACDCLGVEGICWGEIKQLDV